MGKSGFLLKQWQQTAVAFRFHFCVGNTLLMQQRPPLGDFRVTGEHMAQVGIPCPAADLGAVHAAAVIFRFKPVPEFV